MDNYCVHCRGTTGTGGLLHEWWCPNGLGASSVRIYGNTDWFDRHVSTDRIRQLESDLSEARRQLAEWQEAGERVMAEKCPSDEKHCTCVPLLRRQLAALQDVNDATCASYMLDVSNLESRLAEAKEQLHDMDRRLVKALNERDEMECEADRWLKAEMRMVEEANKWHNQWNESNEKLSAAQRDLAEARKIVWLLIRFARSFWLNSTHPAIRATGEHNPGVAYYRLPRWLRKEIER